MNERDQVFRDRLIAVMTELNTNGLRDPELRKKLGGMARRLYRDARARSWADLKERADASTYDSLLKLFQQYSQDAARNGDQVSVRATELLAISLIARRQYQDDLKPGVDALDQFIAETAAAAGDGPGIPLGPGGPR